MCGSKLSDRDGQESHFWTQLDSYIGNIETGEWMQMSRTNCSYVIDIGVRLKENEVAQVFQR